MSISEFKRLKEKNKSQTSNFEFFKKQNKQK